MKKIDAEKAKKELRENAYLTDNGVLVMEVKCIDVLIDQLTEGEQPHEEYEI